MDSAKKIHATLGVFVLRLFPTMIQMILKDNITPGKLHRMFINKTLNTVLTDADIDLMKMLPNMNNFTIDICYKILRFENLIDEPKCKWGNSPHDTDVEISDDIQRILNFSNEIVSKSSEEITKIFPTTFEENVKRIIERVDGYLKGDNCQQLYNNLHIQHIDTSELLNILEHLLQKHPITVIPSILKTDGKTMMRELYSRIAIVITDIFPDILRELILSRITPQNLYKKFDNAFLSSCYLKQRTDLKTSNLTNSFSSLDIPLIYKLLRHFSLIASPSKGWGKDPHPTDLLIADDVERIRMFRNDIAHRCNTNINKNDCDAYFVTFSEIGERIDNHLTGQNSYKQNVIYCKTCVMDTQMQTKYENAAKELENLKLHYERKPVKFYWGDSFEQSLMDLRMMIQNKELEGDEKFRVQIIMQIESDTNNRTVNILNSLRDEINRGLKGIDFLFAFTGSVVLCVDILVEEMETDEKLHLLLFSFMKKIIQTEGIKVPSTEYVNVVLTHSEENTLFKMAKKKTNTSSVVYLDFDIDACHFETDKKMEEALSDIVENVYMKSNGSEIKGDIKATVLPLEFDSNTDIIISEHKEVGKSIQTTAMQSQRRIGVGRMEMDMLEINAVKKFGAKFVDDIYPIPMAEVLRKNCIIDEPFYQEILLMQRNHAPRRVMCEALVNETTKNCNLKHLIQVLYDNGLRNLAKELFLCYKESRNKVALLRVNRADTSNRRKIGEYFKNIKQLVDAMVFKNSLSTVHNLGEKIKKLIPDINDPVQKMYACDKYVALKAAEMDSLTHIAGIVSKDHPGYLEIKRYVSSTSNPALSEVILYGRQSDVLSTIGDFEEAEDFMRQALVSAYTSCSCVEVTDMLYKNVVVKLSKFEKNPHDEELRKSILFEADQGLWTLRDQSEDLRLFWTKLFLLRMAFAHLGIGKFCDIIQNYVPSMQSIVEAERLIKLDPLKDLEHRRQMFIAVAKARLEEWKGNMEAAMKYLHIARELAKEGKYAEDRALADYEILLKKNPWKTHIYERHRHVHRTEEQNSLVLSLRSSILP